MQGSILLKSSLSLERMSGYYDGWRMDDMHWWPIVLWTSCHPHVHPHANADDEMLLICYYNMFINNVLIQCPMFPHQSPPMPPEPTPNPWLRQYWKGSRYTVEEWKVIEPYKVGFQLQESKASWLQILKVDILPAMFNYWVSIDCAPMDDDESCVQSKVNSEACQGCIVHHIDQELTTWLSC
jgi:hypothetical protein